MLCCILLFMTQFKKWYYILVQNIVSCINIHFFFLKLLLCVNNKIEKLSSIFFSFYITIVPYKFKIQKQREIKEKTEKNIPK